MGQRQAWILSLSGELSLESVQMACILERCTFSVFCQQKRQGQDTSATLACLGALILREYQSRSLFLHHSFARETRCQLGTKYNRLGPVVGGLFAQSDVGWRWSFYLNLFAAAVLIPIYLLLLPSLPNRLDIKFWTKFWRIDFLGFCLLVGALISG